MLLVGCVFVNNTFTNNIVVGSVISDLRVENACANDGYYGSGNTYQYNSFGAERPAFISWDHVYMSSYSQWEAAYGQNTYSIQDDPGFFNAAAGQYWLAEGSSCIDSGLDLGSDTSDGLQESSSWPSNVRTANQYQHGSGWEVGAYVSTPPLFIPPPQ